MIERIKTTHMTRKEWLLERRKSVGGSEVGAILGLNQWASPYSVWANKTGRVPDAVPNEAMRQGTDLEEYVAKRFSEKSGLKVERDNAIIRNSDVPHLHANIDRRIVGMRAGLECKTASALSASRFSGGNFPESYYAQCVAYMAVTGYHTFYLAVLVLGKEFKIFRMTRNQEAELPEWCESSVYVSDGELQAVRDAVTEFWRYVEQNVEPPIDGLEATTDALEAVYAESAGGSVDLWDVDDNMRKYLRLKEKIKELKDEQNACANTIKHRLGEATHGSGQHYMATWSPQKRKNFDVGRFAQDHPEIDINSYYSYTTIRRFGVKEI